MTYKLLHMDQAIHNNNDAYTKSVLYMYENDDYLVSILLTEPDWY
jgi:hypothetical protein